MVWGNIWSAHHSEDAWTDPWVFRPERFIDDSGALLPENDPLMEKYESLLLNIEYPAILSNELSPPAWQRQYNKHYVIRLALNKYQLNLI